MLYCTNHKKKGDTAGAKAPSDVFQIVQGLGAEEILFEVVKPYGNMNVRRFAALFVGLKNWFRLIRTAEKGSTIILQHPNENILVANKMIEYCKRSKEYKFIALIHDLDSIRTMLCCENSKALQKRNSLADDELLRKCDCLIVHNEKMKKFLVEQGFQSEKIISLEIFDYLRHCGLPGERKFDKSVIIAGNLMQEKCGYLYSFLETKKLPFVLHLYGPGLVTNVENRDDVIYHGVMKAEELPGKLEGAFGLIWDGTSTNTCSGNAGEYIRYNNPHKTSLYLSSGLPVIIWKEAAMADFVEKNGVGITVSSLNEIGQALDRISKESYQTMAANARKIGEKLRAGYYTKTAVEKCLMRLGI